MAFFLTIGLLAVSGIWLLTFSTPFGLGLNDDSIAYIAGARSILDGQGYREAWLVSNGLVTHFPPGFPAVLAVIGFMTGLDPLRGTRALNGLLFGLNIALSGWIGWRMTGSRIAGILAATFVLLNSSLLYIHTQAMSEPLYIFLSLLVFLLLDHYFERSNLYIIIALGVVLGWAYLARYAALSLLATMIATMLILHDNWRRRLSNIGILSLSAFPWIFAWSIRNRVVGGSFTNRVLGWHPITFQNWRKAKGTFTNFLLPVEEWQRVLSNIPNFFTIVFISIGLVLLIWVIVQGLPRLFKPAKYAQPHTLPFVNGLYVIAYLLTLFITMTLFDAATKFQVRILSPIFISLILLMVTLGTWLWHRKNTTWKIIVLLLAVGFLGMFAYVQIISVQDWRKGGDAFTGEKWSASEAITALSEISPDVLIISNEPGVIYLYTGRPSGILPKKEPGISNIKQPVLDGKIVIVLFRVNRVDPETLSYYYQLGRGLYLTDYSNTWVFSAFPE